MRLTDRRWNLFCCRCLHRASPVERLCLHRRSTLVKDADWIDSGERLSLEAAFKIYRWVSR